MPLDPPNPEALPPRPPAPKMARAPVPAWMWLTFGLAPIVLGLIGFLLAFSENSGEPVTLALSGAGGGLVLALPLLGGLALAGRFFSTVPGRIFGGLMFAGILVLGLGAVAFAGCMCLMQQSSFR